MKYKVISTLLTSPQKDFRAGDVVTESDLKPAGFNAEFLIAGGHLSPLEGTEDDSPAAPGGTQGTDPVPMKTGTSGQTGTSSAAAPALDLPLDDAALAGILKTAGLDTADKVKAATDDDLKAISGIGPASIAKIRAAQS